jgi:hypothetical protein
MTHSLKLAGAFILATLLFTSCKDCDTTVTQIDENDAAWLSYEHNDTVNFLNELGDTVQYVNIAMRAEQIPGEGFNISDDCIEHYDVQAFAILEEQTKKNPSLMTYFIKRENSFLVSLAVEGRGDYKLNLDEPTYPSLEVNGMTYLNVYEVLQTNQADAGRIKRMLYNKTHGFLSIEFYGDKKLELINEE